MGILATHHMRQELLTVVRVTSAIRRCRNTFVTRKEMSLHLQLRSTFVTRNKQHSMLYTIIFERRHPENSQETRLYTILEDWADHDE